MTRPLQSLGLRLAARFALAFAVSLLALFAALEVYLRHAARRETDRFLSSEAQRMADLLARRKVRILQADFDRFARFHGEDRVLLRILDRDGTLLASSDTNAWPSIPAAAASDGDGTRFETSGRFPDRIRSAFAPAYEGRTVHLARRLDAPDRSLRQARLFVATGFAFSLLAGTALSFLAVRQLLRRMNAIRETAADIAAGDLSRRVPAGGRPGDELQELAGTLNDMLARIEALVTDVKNVTDDIAHELKTPLTRIRGTAEPLLLDPAAAPAVRDAAGLVVEECDRLNRMIVTMLQIARLEAGRDRPALETLDVRDVARETVTLFETVAEDRAVRLDAVEPERPLPVRADRSSLQRILTNLVDNALRATPAGGRVRIVCSGDGRVASLAVEDTGTGIPAEDLPHLFERFHRSRNSRTGEGTGLGLCLVRALVRAHGGDVSVESRTGEGSRFVVTLPAAL